MDKEFDTEKTINPLITVAMSIYNAGEHLRPAVLSVIHQTYKNWELYIVDDGSTDDALSTIADIQDSRIKIINDGLNKGLAARLNEIINFAKGDYFARMDQDDVSYPERFIKQIKALKEDPSLDLLATRAIKITMENMPIGYFPYGSTHQEITSSPWRGFYMVHPTWMGKLQWFRKHCYAEPAPYLCEDQELLLRSYSVSSFACLQDVCLAYRVRDKISLRKLLKIRYQQLRVQLDYAINKKLIKFLLLAICLFIVKSINDSYRTLFCLEYAPLKKNNISRAELITLNQILTKLK